MSVWHKSKIMEIRWFDLRLEESKISEFISKIITFALLLFKGMAIGKKKVL